MKKPKISRKLLKARMDALFLSYGYRVASLSSDLAEGEIDQDDFKERVAVASRDKLNKAIALWKCLYDNGEVPYEFPDQAVS